MLLNQHQPDQPGANDQANTTSNLIKFDNSNSYSIPFFRDEKTPMTLLKRPLKFFKYIPKDFTITTENGSYIFNKYMLIDTSSVILKFITENPKAEEYHLDIKDDNNVMKKIEEMYNGKNVNFDDIELNVLRQITSSLNIVCCPKFMKFETFKLYEDIYSYRYEDYSAVIDLNSLKLFLDENYPKNFTISTNNKEYKCNKIGIKTSLIINEQLEKNPDLDSYKFDFDDEFNIFQEICNFFNFLPIEITIDNMHVLKKIANDLQIDCIIESITNIIESYETAVQKIDEKRILIDPIVDLCNDLYNIKNIGVENVQEKIIGSVWSSTEENIQELICYLIQVIHSDFDLHPYIMNLILNLDKSSTDLNELKKLLHIFIKQIMFAFPKNKLNCAFVFRMIQNKLISIDEVLTKLSLYAKIYRSNKKKGLFSISVNEGKSEKEIFINTIENAFDYIPEIDPLNLKNAIIWFFPELMSLSNKYVNSLIKENPNIKNFQVNGIERFKKMRENFEPDDELTKAILNDDVDTLQKIMNQYQLKLKLISFNLFDSITENGNNSIINYAISKGSIKCFKYLLLNHHQLDESSLYYSVLGKNVEIIRIVDQYCNSNKITINHQFNSDDFVYKRYYDYDDKNDSNSSTKIRAPIIPAIIMHQNEIFDWILEQKYINNGITGNALIDVVVIAVQNGNAHAFIQCVDRGFDISSIPTRNIRKIIEQSSRNGFYKIIQLIFSLISPKLLNTEICFTLDLEDSIICGNLSLVKLYFSLKGKNNFDIEKGLCIAVEKGYLHIIKSLFETDFADNIEFKEKAAAKAFAISVLNHQTEVFDYLFKFTCFPHVLSEDSLYKLLSYFCYLGDLKATETFTEFILNHENLKRDFSESLLYAAISGHEKICQYLIDRKVLINYSKLVSNSSIFTSCNKIIFSIIFDSSEPEVKETFIGQLLNSSIKNQNLEIIEFLIEKGSPFNNALFEAVLTKNIEIVNIILKHNNKPYFINKLYKNGTALNKAVILGEYEIVKRLLSIPGIDPSLYANNNVTPLVSAITKFHLDIFNLILDFYGNSIETQTWQLNEALKAILRILSEGEKAPYSPKNNNNKLIINNNNEEEEEAEEEEKEEGYMYKYQFKKAVITDKKRKSILNVLKRLIKIKNIDLNCRENKYTLLTFACETNEIDLVSMLIKLDNVNVNSYAPKNGNTPLMIAIENKNTKIAKLLINLPKTNINMRNYNGKTALTIAVEKNLNELVDIIINNEKFDPEESLLDYAFYISKGELSKQLFSLKNLNVNYKFYENDGKNDQYEEDEEESYNKFYHHQKIIQNKSILFMTTLIHAVNEKDKEKIELIIKHPSFDPIKSQIKSSLFSSVSAGNIDIFRLLLLKNNNDVNICSQSQESLLSYAIRLKRDEIVDEIISNENFDCNKTDILSAFLKTYSLDEIQKQKIKQKQQDNYYEYSYDYHNSYNHYHEMLIDASLKTMNSICKFDENHNHSIDFSKILPNGKSFFTNMSPFLKNSGDVATFLLNHGAFPDEPDNFGEYPLKYIIENDIVGAALVLIRSGKVDLTRRFILIEEKFIFSESKNATYLHLAACLKSSEILSELLDKNIYDINCKDNSDETPLIKAIKHKSLNNINLLFSKDNLDYDNKDSDIIGIAKNIVDYRKNDEVHLKTKEDYLEYLTHIMSSSRY